MINHITSSRLNIIKPKLENKTGYCLRLANGQWWHISVSGQLGPWADKLADIMQLKPCESNGYPKLMLICNKSEKDQCEASLCRSKENVVEELSAQGWDARFISGIRFWFEPDGMNVICEIETGDENLDVVMMRHSLYPIYQRAQDEGALPLHAGLVECNGVGVLLAAPTNIGKSTCCRRIPRPWNALCDEETLIVRHNKRKYLAHPFPTWSDYLVRRSNRTWNVQHYVPLRAIFFIEQAEVEGVLSLGQGEAAVLINQSAMQVYYRYWYDLDYEELRTKKKKLFENACELAKAVPAYRLRVSLYGRFWEEMENVLE